MSDDVTTLLVLFQGVIYGLLLAILYASVASYREVKRENKRLARQEEPQ